MAVRAKATNQGHKVWPDLSAPQGFKHGYANPPHPGKIPRQGSLGQAAEGAVQHALRMGSKRVTQINETTRKGIRQRIHEAIEQGMSPQEAGQYVREWSGFDEYRAERIARTEMMFSYNAAALGTYQEAGIQQVVADDGDEDEECAARHGQVFTVDEADGIQDHPNGTLDWLPVDPGSDPNALREALNQERPIADMAQAADQELIAHAPALPESALTLAHNGLQLLEKTAQGQPLSNAETNTLMQAHAAGHIDSQQLMEAVTKGQKRQSADHILEKLKSGDELNGPEWQALEEATQMGGHLTEAIVDDAMNQGVLAKAKKKLAADALDSISKGEYQGYVQVQAVQDMVQAGLIDQAQVDQAYMMAKVAKQEKELADALAQVATKYATGSEKQLVLDAMNQGTITADQEKQLGKDILAKLAAKEQLDSQEQELLSVLLKHNSIKPHELVDAINAGQKLAAPLTQQQQLDKDYILSKLESGTPLSPADQGIYSDLKIGGKLTDQEVTDALAKAPKGTAANPVATSFNPYPGSWSPQTLAKQQALDKQQLLEDISQGKSLNLDDQKLLQYLKDEGHITAQEIQDAIGGKLPGGVKPKAKPKLKGKGGVKSNGPDTFDAGSFQPPTYATRDEHDAALSAWQHRADSKLTWEERRAVEDYTNSGYHSINGTLRGIDMNRRSASEIRDAKKSADLVSHAMHPTTEDTLVRRGMGPQMFGFDAGADLDKVQAALKAGQEWMDSGFMSTSINRGHSWSGEVLLELKVPRGTPASYVQTISSHKSEYELLLDSGTRIVIDSVERPSFGQVKVYAHVKPR